ncbi:MAG: YfhO family protein [Verrucomicrobia bacterium]|nr:YfhO family protein [Verrucomicrobiota bacterium]
MAAKCIEEGARPGREIRPVVAQLALLVLMAALLFQPFLLGQKTYLFRDIGSDSVNHVYPMLVHVSDYLRSDGFPRWSFNQGLGQCLISRDLGDPFNWLMFLMPRNAIVWAMAWVEALKVILAGLFFFLYLRLLPLSRYAATVGSLCFAFCGYLVSGGGIGVMSTESVYLALLLYAYELYFRRGQWRLLPPAFALLAALQPLNLYLFGLFLAFYSAVRFFDVHGVRVRPWFGHLLRIAGCGLLGAAMASVILFGSLLQIVQSPRLTGGASYSRTLMAQPWRVPGGLLYYGSAILRLFSNDLMGTGSYFRGWYNYYEAPLFYAGLPLLLLAPILFFLLDRRRRGLYGVAAAAALLPIAWPYARYAFWLFTGDYFRTYSLFFAFGLIFFSLQALDRLRDRPSFDRLRIFWVLACLLAALFWSGYIQVRQHTDPALGTLSAAPMNLLNKPLAWGMAGLLTAYALLLCGVARPRWKQTAEIGLLLLLSGELVFMAGLSIRSRPVVTGAQWREKNGYNDHTVEAVQHLKALDPGFFRVVKEYSSTPAVHRSLNDGKVQRYFGITSYNSFNQRSFIDFLRELGAIEPGDELEARWADGLLRTPLIHPLLSANYLLTRESFPEPGPAGYVPLGQFGDVHAFSHRFALPFGFSYPACMRYRDYHALPGAEKQSALLYAAVVEDGLDLAGLLSSSRTTFPDSPEDVQAATDVLRQEVLQLREFHQNRISGFIDLRTTKLLFFSIPYDPGWRAKVNGIRRPLVRANVGFMGLVLEPGRHDITLSYHPPGLASGCGVSAAAVLAFILLARRRDPPARMAAP